jgi:hypothetical protein
VTAKGATIFYSIVLTLVRHWLKSHTLCCYAYYYITLQDYERKFIQPHGFVVTDCATSNCKACLDKAYPKSRDDYTGCGLHTKESDGLQYAYWYPLQSTTQVSIVSKLHYVHCPVVTICTRVYIHHH